MTVVPAQLRLPPLGPHNGDVYSCVCLFVLSGVLLWRGACFACAATQCGAACPSLSLNWGGGEVRNFPHFLFAISRNFSQLDLTLPDRNPPPPNLPTTKALCHPPPPPHLHIPIHTL